MKEAYLKFSFLISPIHNNYPEAISASIILPTNT